MADPILTSIDPASAPVASADFTLHCVGQNFDELCKIVFNGGEEPTTLVSPTELTTGVKPSTASGPITVPVLVRRLAVDSAALDFSFTEAIAADAISLDNLMPPDPAHGDYGLHKPLGAWPGASDDVVINCLWIGNRVVQIGYSADNLDDIHTRSRRDSDPWSEWSGLASF